MPDPNDPRWRPFSVEQAKAFIEWLEREYFGRPGVQYRVEDVRPMMERTRAQWEHRAHRPKRGRLGRM